MHPWHPSRLHCDPWNATLGNYGVTVYTQLGGDVNTSNDTITDSVSVQNLTKVYCYIAYDPSSAIPKGPAWTSLQNPGSIISIADQSSSNFVKAGTWGGNKKWYGVVTTDNTLITLDTTTGARTVIGNLGIAINGISYDYTTSKLYGVSYDGTNSALHIINTATGAATQIGVCGAGLYINLACDASGNLYAVDISTDNLVQINATTGVGAVIGLIGFNASYAQDMEFDRNTNTLYMAAYNADASKGELRTVNTTTGTTTLIGDFAGGAEITGFAIPYYPVLPANDVAATGITSPGSACGLGSETVTIVVQNFGTSVANNVPVYYKVNGGAPVSGTITSIPVDGSASYTFSTPVDMSATGVYNIKAYTALAGDAVLGNDTATKVVTNFTPQATPYTMGFETTENYSNWVIENTNGDAKTWIIVATGGNNGPYAAEYPYNSASAANDWLITTCLDFIAGTTYQLDFYYKAQSATWPEKLNVFLGTDNISTALTTSIVDVGEITATTYTLSSSQFTVPTTGSYYIGFHCYSDADMYNLFVDDINIDFADKIITNEVVENNINVYPNPSTGVFYVSKPANSTITIYNNLGDAITAVTNNATLISVDMNGLSDGMYILKVQTENNVVTKKINLIR